MVEIFSMVVSAPCRAVLLTAKALEIEHTTKNIDLMKGEQMAEDFVAMNPAHVVPTVKDGDFVLWESRCSRSDRSIFSLVTVWLIQSYSAISLQQVRQREQVISSRSWSSRESRLSSQLRSRNSLQGHRRIRLPNLALQASSRWGENEGMRCWYLRQKRQLTLSGDGSQVRVHGKAPFQGHVSFWRRSFNCRHLHFLLSLRPNIRRFLVLPWQ